MEEVAEVVEHLRLTDNCPTDNFRMDDCSTEFCCSDNCIAPNGLRCLRRCFCPTCKSDNFATFRQTTESRPGEVSGDGSLAEIGPPVSNCSLKNKNKI